MHTHNQYVVWLPRYVDNVANGMYNGGYCHASQRTAGGLVIIEHIFIEQNS